MTTRSSAPRYGAMVLLLTLIQILSFVDRYLPSLLIAPLKAQYKLTDFQVGLLIGPAFALLYVIVGVPVGGMVDRKARNILLGAGVLIWSVSTSLGAVAMSFAVLFLCRLGVGLGEAVLTPCAVSLIGDRVPAERRPRALGIFQSGAAIGTSLTFVAGGAAIYWLATHPDALILGGTTFSLLQVAFILAGAPGFVLAAFAFRLKDTRRAIRCESAPKPKLSEFLRYVSWHRLSVAALFGAGIGYTMLTNLSSWKFALFDRVWHWNTGWAGPILGVADLIGYLSGIALAIVLQEYWGKRDRGATAPMRAIAVGLAIAVAGTATFPMVTSPWMAVLLSGVASIGIACCTASGLSSVSNAFPAISRGQATAFYFLAKTVGGMVVGPPLVGSIVDMFGFPAALRYAIPIVALGIGPLMILLVIIAMGHIERTVKAAALQEAAV